MEVQQQQQQHGIVEYLILTQQLKTLACENEVVLGHAVMLKTPE